MVDMLDTAPSMRRLPFSFANRFKTGAGDRAS